MWQRYIDGIVTACTNSGTITGVDYVGGIVSDNADGTITDCNNSGTVTTPDDPGHQIQKVNHPLLRFQI